MLFFVKCSLRVRVPIYNKKTTYIHTVKYYETDKMGITHHSNYIRFMEETGAEQVASYLNWVYFRKKTAEGPFEIFSDIESQLKHYILIKKLLVPFGILNLCVGILNVINCWFNIREMFWVPFINIALAVLIFAGLSGINKKIKALKKESTIFE